MTSLPVCNRICTVATRLYTGNIISKVLGGKPVGGTAEQQDDPDSESSTQPSQSTSIYEVVGTLSNSEATKPSWVTSVIQNDDREHILSALLSCDIIIYHSTGSKSQTEEALWAVQSLHNELSSFIIQKVFIYVSSILTWARSKPLDQEDPDIPFTDEEYRRRRAHPNFKEQIELEKVVVKLGKSDKSKFISYVVAAGLTYGQGEDIFHFFFKTAWYGEVPYLHVFGEGQNIIPMVHILDLTNIILFIADNRPKTRYILAVDESNNTLEEVVKAISSALGTGKTKQVPKEDALLHKEISQCDYDHYLVNLQMEAVVAKEMPFDWKTETGLVENISKIVKEYKEARGLQPHRICVLGAPAVGKSYIVSHLCQHYKLHHIKIADVIKEAIDNLERTAARSDLRENSDDDDVTDDDDGVAQEARDKLDLLKEYFDENNGRYSEEDIIDFYKKKLRSMPCQNQGFILDGYPKTYEQAKNLFAPDEEDEEEGTGDDEGSGNEIAEFSKLTMPEVVISLCASDSFLKDRVMNLPQSEVGGTHNTEEGFLKRLNLFRELNQEDTTVLNYFDELEIHPKIINVEEEKSENIFDKLYQLIGKPRNYGPTPEEKEAMERKLLEERIIKETQERERKEKMEQEERELRAEREAEWQTQLELVQKEEKEMLETRSMPLRNYLMRHVMPTLSQGLIEACKVKPDDPIDYLAEYLFKHNPQID